MEAYIKQKFTEKCGVIAEKFSVVNFPVVDQNFFTLQTSGVYIIYVGDRVWKVGKSESNVVKRAYQHFRDDTGANVGKGMKKYLSDPEMKIMLLYPKDKTDGDWISSVERIME